MAKKKKEPADDSTLIRVSKTFAEAIRDAAAPEKISVADFADSHLAPLVAKRYRDWILKEAKRFEAKRSTAIDL